MTLKLHLAPGESLLIGKARVTNGGTHKSTLVIEGTEKVIRQDRIMLERDANTPAKTLYFVVQGIYLSDEPEKLFPVFHEASRAVVSVMPELVLTVTEIGQIILGGMYYGALNVCHRLMKEESDRTTPRKEVEP